MASLFKNLFSGWNTTPAFPRPELHLRIILSSDILHKHGPEKVTVTLEVTHQCHKPLTILIARTILSTWGSPFNDGGLNLVDTETSIPVPQAECLVNYGCNICDIPISHEFSNDFVTLMPGVPFQVNHDIRPTPRGLDSIPNRPLRELSEEVASRIVLAMLTHTRDLQVGSTYRVELEDRRNRIHWYRFGTKEEVLSGVGGTRRNERVGHLEMERLPLILQNEATVRVVE